MVRGGRLRWFGREKRLDSLGLNLTEGKNLREKNKIPRIELGKKPWGAKNH